jgi:hypothetical protein
VKSASAVARAAAAMMPVAVTAPTVEPDPRCAGVPREAVYGSAAVPSSSGAMLARMVFPTEVRSSRTREQSSQLRVC